MSATKLMQKSLNKTPIVLREECGIDSKTVRRLRTNENIETKTIDMLLAHLKKPFLPKPIDI